MYKNLRNRAYFADVLRAIAIIAVVVLHYSSDKAGAYGHITNSDWLASAFYNGITRFCVPLFVALSGSLLLTKPVEPISTLFKKRLPNLLIPLVVWSIIYTLADRFLFNQVKDYHIAALTGQFYRGPLVFHFWFLYMMIGVYLCYPIIHVFVSAAKEVHILYFLAVWFVVNCLLSLVEAIFETPIGIDLNFFTGYIGYFVLGYYVSTARFVQKYKPVYACILIGCLVLSVLMIVLLYTLHAKQANDIVESDFTPELPFVVAALFLVAKFKVSPEPKCLRLREVVTLISRESYGVYIIHVLVMRLLSKTFIGTDLMNRSPLVLTIPIMVLITLNLSILCVSLLRRIPLSRYFI